jgi:uncharacterized membrane protein HdeD (DUF308 family)
MQKRRFSNWWFLALNGGIFIFLGVLLLFFTMESILTMIKYFGIILLAGGAILLFLGINKIRRDKSAAIILMEAIASIAIGLALIFFSQPTLALFLMLIGIWAIIIGIIQLVIIVNIKGVLANKNLMLINGLLTIALGILLLFKPFDWAVFMGKIIGICSALFGILLVYFSFGLRTYECEVTNGKENS